jgi:hypothetical protein
MDNWTKTYKYNNLNTYERNLKNDKFERGSNYSDRNIVNI